jgi:hypothetical protein
LAFNSTVSTDSDVITVPECADSDFTDPAAVIDLAASNATTSSIDLSWTAPGDDGDVGTAELYDIRYSTSPIASDSDFAGAAQVSGENSPQAAGTAETMTVLDLEADTLYYFALKTQDDAPNLSFMSNVPSLSTAAAPDTVPPADIEELVASDATTSTIKLSWTAPGDDGVVGTAASYDIRYSTSIIDDDADFTAAAQVTGEPTPSVAGTAETVTVTGLSASTLYHFVIKAQDEAPNKSGVTNASLSTAAAPDTIAPAAVTTLALSGATTTSLALAWTAPGDNGSVGTATAYDIRYSTSPIVTPADFTAASLVTGEPAPLVAGTAQTMTVTGLASGTQYYFVMKSSDEAPNSSLISNMPSLSTTAVSSGGGGGGGGGGSFSPLPVLSKISAASITKNSAVVTWTTDVPSDSLVRLGPTAAYGTTATGAALMLPHVASITGLLPGTSYHYSACSRNSSGSQVCSGDFTFTTLAADAPATAFDVAAVIASSPTINVDKSITAIAGARTECAAGTMIKLPSDGVAATQADSAVYYCGANGKRYVFPDPGTYQSWYPDFSAITIVSAEKLAKMPIGGNVTYRPGSLIKVRSIEKVYAVGKSGNLRWVKDEATASALYGPNWSALVRDVSEAYFADYVIGDPILSAS